MTIEYKNKNKIFLNDMACPSENNEDAKYAEKLEIYHQLAFEIREKQPGYNVMMISVVISYLGGGMRQMTNQIEKLISMRRKQEQYRTKWLR